MNIKLCIPGFARLQPNASTREKILAAAAELLLTEGFHALTQHAVATRAGVRQSHLTYYFPTRNDLLRGTAQYGIETLLAPLEALRPADGTPGNGNVITLAELRQLLTPEKSDRQWFRLLVGLMVASDEDPSIRQWLQEFDARIMATLAAAFVAAGASIETSKLRFLHCALTGALQLDMQAPSDASFAQVVQTFNLAFEALLGATPQAAAAETHPAAPPASQSSTLFPTREFTP